jgi:hypothetical protein
MTDDDLERARKKVDQQTKDANRRASLGERLRRWYEDQAAQNGFREMVDAITRGQM